MSIKVLGKSISHGVFSSGLTGGLQIIRALLSFLMVPILMGWLSTDKYSIWVTMISLVGWIDLFDFGIGYGFKNEVTRYLVHKDREKMKRLFEQNFQYYFLFLVILFIFFIGSLFFFNLFVSNRYVAIAIYLPMILAFPAKISVPILQGMRLSHVSSFIQITRSLLFIIMVLGLINFTEFSNLIVLAVCYSVLSFFVDYYSLFLAVRKLGIELPKIEFLFRKPVYDQIIKVGLRFFILQVSSILLFSMGNYYVYSFLDSKSTVNYDTINKLYSFSLSIFNIAIGVYWAEIVYFKSEGNIPKLKKIHTNLFIGSIIFSLLLFISTFIFPLFIGFWTNGKVTVSQSDCLPFSILLSVQAIAYAGAVFLNAFEKTQLQFYLVIFDFIFLPFLLYYGFEMGLGFIVPPLASAILVFPAAIILNIYARKLIKPN